MLDKLYELPLSKEYVRHWGVVEALRELFQNALDSDSPFEYSIGTDSINITSKYSRLEPKTLLLGTTSKADAVDKIGSFGEGYKIALLVLAREDRRVVIYNNDIRWTPEFRMNKHFQEEILCIRESKYSEGRGKGLTFSISGLTQSEIDQVIETNMHMWDSVGQVIDTSYGSILLDHPGKLFVNGLFVCETRLKYGYNMKPEHLKLERDRQTVNSFDLKFTAKQMWFETKRYEQIAEMIAEEVEDLEYANYGTPEMVKEECYKLFVKNHPNSVAAGSQKELEALVAQGLERVVYIGGGTYHSCITTSPSYSKREAIIIKSPNTLMAEWFKENRQHMRREAIASFKALLIKSNEWKLK